MAKKIIGIVLIAAALFTVIAAICTGTGTENREIIENAVYVAEGKVLAENEGKVVIVTGKLDAPLPFIDKETGIALHSLINDRRVEKLSISQETEDSREEWSWTLSVSTNDYGGSKKVFAPGLTLGEFSVAEELLLSLSATYKRETYDKKELNRGGWNQFEDKDRVYLYKGNSMPREDEYVGNDYNLYLGTLRVAYGELPPEDSLEYTLIGLQSGGKLLPAEELDMKAAHAGKLTVEDILTYEASSTKSGMIMGIAIGVALAAFGVVMIVKSGKKPGPDDNFADMDADSF